MVGWKNQIFVYTYNFSSFLLHVHPCFVLVSVVWVDTHTCQSITKNKIYIGFIGKRHLYNAIHEVLQNPNLYVQRPITGFSIVRVPFFLEPDYDAQKVYVETNRQRLLRKWGGPQLWEQQKQRHQLKERGQEVQIPHFNLDRQAANTMTSHRLIQYISRTYGLYASECIYDVLNQYHFVDGHSLNDWNKLSSVVHTELQKLYHRHPNVLSVNNHPVTVPPTEQELLQFLKSNVGRIEILDAIHVLQQMGINGIPTFIMDGGNIVLNGAIHASEFVRTFRRIEQRGFLNDPQPLFSDLLGIPSKIIQRGTYHVENTVMNTATVKS
jgi:predicted DsbA family dithiol-disulfide isomerase